MVRGANGRPLRENAFFLNPEKAAQEFVHPVIEGLGKKAGPLVFEMAQVPRELISSAEKRIRLVERIGEFLNRLPKIGEEAENAFYAVEIRTPIIYTPRFVSMLRGAGARLVTGLHPTMPDVARQTNALHMMDCPEAESPEDFRLAGPLVVRWTLAMGDRFDDAKGVTSRSQRSRGRTRSHEKVLRLSFLPRSAADSRPMWWRITRRRGARRSAW